VDLQKHGIELGGHLIMQGSQKAHVNVKIFGQHVKSTFLPYAAELRSEREIEQDEAALLICNCPSYLTSEVMDVLTTAMVRIATFTSRTTHIFQLLDLTPLGTFNRVGKYHVPFGDLTSTLCFIHRFSKDFKRTAMPADIWVAFGGIGIESDIITVPYRVMFHSEKLKESKGFEERSEIDLPLAILSTRQRNFRFGWLNKRA
jgi:hypothetical protein